MDKWLAGVWRVTWEMDQGVYNQVNYHRISVSGRVRTEIIYLNYNK